MGNFTQKGRPIAPIRKLNKKKAEIVQIHPICPHLVTKKVKTRPIIKLSPFLLLRAGGKSSSLNKHFLTGRRVDIRPFWQYFHMFCYRLANCQIHKKILAWSPPPHFLALPVFLLHLLSN